MLNLMEFLPPFSFKDEMLIPVSIRFLINPSTPTTFLNVYTQYFTHKNSSLLFLLSLFLNGIAATTLCHLYILTCKNGLSFRKQTFPFHHPHRNPAAWTIPSGYENTCLLPHRFGYLRNIFVCKPWTEEN